MRHLPTGKTEIPFIYIYPFLFFDTKEVLQNLLIPAVFKPCLSFTSVSLYLQVGIPCNPKRLQHIHLCTILPSCSWCTLPLVCSHWPFNIILETLLTLILTFVCITYIQLMGSKQTKITCCFFFITFLPSVYLHIFMLVFSSVHNFGSAYIFIIKESVQTPHSLIV